MIHDNDAHHAIIINHTIWTAETTQKKFWEYGGWSLIFPRRSSERFRKRKRDPWGKMTRAWRSNCRTRKGNLAALAKKRERSLNEAKLGDWILRSDFVWETWMRQTAPHTVRTHLSQQVSYRLHLMMFRISFVLPINKCLVCRYCI